MTESLHPQKLQMQHYCTTSWRATVPVGTTVDDILRPGFWAHIARGQIKVFDKIEVLSDDGEMDVELRVTGLGQQAIMTRIIRGQVASPAAKNQRSGPVAAPGEPRVEFSPVDKWRVIDAAGDVVARNLPTVDEAEAALSRHMGSLEAA